MSAASPLRSAVIQMCSGIDVGENLMAAERLLQAAADEGAQLLVLPENFALMAEHREALWQAAEQDGDGPIQGFLSRVSRRLGVWIVGGTLPLGERGQRPRAASLVFDETGRRVARYDKIHLFDAALHSGGYRESSRFEPGDRLCVCDGPGIRLGLSVCYDLRFPRQFQALAARGAQAMLAPSAFTEETGQAHWDVLIRARAIDTLSYVLAPAQHGLHGNGRRTFGGSSIVDPWGEIIARCDPGPGFAVADLDTGKVATIRKRLPAVGANDAEEQYA